MYLSQFSILDYFQNGEVGENLISTFLDYLPCQTTWISTAILMKPNIKAKYFNSVFSYGSKYIVNWTLSWGELNCHKN